RRRRRSDTWSGRAAASRDRGFSAAPCLSYGRPCRRGTASLRRRPFGGLRYPLDMSARHAIGVDLGGTKILAGVVARDGRVLRRHERATPHDSQDSVVRELEAAVVELLGDDVGAVGFGAPSPIDQRRGVVVAGVNLPLADFP